MSSYERFTISRHGFWFIDIPRTSSSSIRAELGMRFGKAHGKMNVMETDYATAQIIPDHTTAKEVQTVIGRPKWDKIFTFTVVRNPWERTFSMYHYRKKRGNIPKEWSFRDYVLELSASTPETKYSQFYDLEMQNAIRKFYSKDIKLLNYCFDDKTVR